MVAEAFSYICRHFDQISTRSNDIQSLSYEELYALIDSAQLRCRNEVAVLAAIIKQVVERRRWAKGGAPEAAASASSRLHKHPGPGEDNAHARDPC